METFFSKNIQLSYLDINLECEQTLIFIHGNSHSKNSFRNQLNSKEFSGYRLIAIDLPGHGESSPMEIYSLKELAQNVRSLIESLQLNKYVFVGHSLGGHVALQLLSSLSPKGILIFGTPPLPKPISLVGFLPNEAAAPLSKEAATPAELETLAKELQYILNDKNVFLADYFKTDKKFRTLIFETLFQGEYLDEVKLLRDTNSRVVSLIMSEDGLINGEYIKKSDIEYFELKAPHSPHITHATEFNSFVKKFALECFDELLNVRNNIQTYTEERI